MLFTAIFLMLTCNEDAPFWVGWRHTPSENVLKMKGEIWNISMNTLKQKLTHMSKGVIKNCFNSAYVF